MNAERRPGAEAADLKSAGQPVGSIAGRAETATAALQYAARGWPSFPLSRSKIPLKDSHGHLDATTDTEMLWHWFGDGGHNIGLACTLGTGLAALDVDPRKNGLETMADLERRRGELPATLTAITGRGDGGFHLYYQHPGRKLTSNLGDESGVDIKGNGYTVAPPSRHKSGGTYKWVDFDVPVAPWPPIIDDEIEALNLRKTNAAACLPGPPLPPRYPPGRDGHPYGLAALRNAKQRMRQATEEAHNLNSATNEAFGIGRLVSGGLLRPKYAYVELLLTAEEMPGRAIREKVEKSFWDGYSQPRVVAL